MLAWDQAPQWGEKEKTNRKNIGEQSEPSSILGRGKGRRSLETCLWRRCSMIPDSGIMLWLFSAVLLTVLRSFNITLLQFREKDFLKHGFQASNTNFFVRLLAYLLASRTAKNIPLICCKKKKKHIECAAFFILSSDKPLSHLQRDWLINRRAKGRVL